MKRKQIINRLNKAYRTGKLKRTRPHIPEHPLIIALKAFSLYAQGTVALLKGISETYEQSPESGDRHIDHLNESGLLQLHSDAGQQLNKALNHLNNQLSK